MNFLRNVLVIAIDGDFTVQQVIDWMSVKGASIDRIVLYDDNILFPFSIEELDLYSSIVMGYDLKLYDKIWFHRSRRIISMPPNSFRNRIIHFQKEEIRTILNYLLSELPERLFVIPPTKVDMNKLFVLKKAKNLGIKIPHTIITNRKDEVLEFIDKYGSSVIKPLSNCFSMVYENLSYSMFTSIINKELLDKQEELLFPIMVQDKIEKKYEIRTFFLNKTMYSMAIFSQLDSLSRTDWRISQQNNNLIRNVPYLLPYDIQEKVRLLMDGLGLKTGSIDFILSEAGEFVFLEVNPVGQFGMVSELCNYSLYNKFADFILSEKNND